MTLRELKMGIVGFGWFGKKHYSIWSDLDFVKVIAIADKNIKEVIKTNENLQEKFHIETSGLGMDLENISLYKSVEEMLANEDLDVVDIVVDEKAHYSVAKTALEYGAHVIIEKPFVTKLSHALELREISQREGKKIF